MSFRPSIRIARPGPPGRGARDRRGRRCVGLRRPGAASHSRSPPSMARRSSRLPHRLGR